MSFTVLRRLATVSLVVAPVLAAACSSDESAGGTSAMGLDGGAAASGIGGSGSGGTGAGAGGTGTGSTGAGGILTTNQYLEGGGGMALCANGVPCQCSDGIDNDGDGTTDGFDAECTGPFDNDEGSFATGIPGDNMDPKWQDCFFDGDSGAGNDGCRYNTGCVTGALPPTDPSCVVSQLCIDYCMPMTPNGCDCFGCCTVRGTDGKDYDVFIGDTTCTQENLAACQSCTQSTQCGNTCGTCELCPGRTVADLPASCRATSTDGGSATGTDAAPAPGYTCSGGETLCTSNADCSASQYCSYGCCMTVIY